MYFKNGFEKQPIGGIGRVRVTVTQVKVTKGHYVFKNGFNLIVT